MDLKPVANRASESVKISESPSSPPTTTPRHAGLEKWLVRFLHWLLTRIFQVRAKGWNQLPEEGGVLLIANHLSYADAVLLAATCPRPVRFLGAAKLRRSRFLRWAFERFGVIPVAPEDALSVVRQATGALRKSEVVAIFPEGSISLSGQLLPFQRGFMTLARRAQVPVVPVGLAYDEEIAKRGFSAWIRSKYPKLRMPWNARISVAGPLNSLSLKMEDARQSIMDAGFDAFNARPELNEHLAARAVRDLKKHLFHRHVVDLSTGRKELKSGMILAVALTMAARWKDNIPEKRVGVVFPSSLGGMLTNLALTLLGKTPVNLNFTAGRSVNEKCMAAAGIRTVISAGPVIKKVPDFPWPENTIDLVAERKHLGKPKILWNLAKLVALPTEGILRHFDVPTAGGEREAAILFSSGSTGDPKGVVLSHRNVVANCEQIAACGLLSPDQTMLACLPIFHSFGFTANLWYSLLSGLKLVCLPSPLETKRCAEAVRDEKITVMMGTPTFYRPYFKRVPAEWLKSLSFIVGGAEKTPRGFDEKWKSQFGSDYLEGYGLTETSPVLACNLPYATDGKPNARVGSVGRLFPGIKGRIIDPTTGEVLPTGSTGILEVQGANVFRGYLDDAYATHACFRDGWFVTGDLARFDEDGFLFIEGRLSRFSKIGGEMVPHGTVEQEIITAFELDQEDEPVIAVAGVSDPQKGEALVVLAAIELKIDEIRQRLSAKGLPNLWIPRRLIRVPKIPCLATGKLDLRGVARLAENAG